MKTLHRFILILFKVKILIVRKFLWLSNFIIDHIPKSCKFEFLFPENERITPGVPMKTD